MNSFATAVNCMDGRVQVPVIEYLRRTYGVDHVDMITLPGPNKVLAEGTDRTKLDVIWNGIRISIERHGSGLIAIVGHHDCAGNPADEKNQRSHIVTAIETVRSRHAAVRVIGLWVDQNWLVHELTCSEREE